MFCVLTVSISNAQQSITYIGHATQKSNIKERILFDSTTHIRYVLDTGSIYITAIDASGKQLWRTDPWKDNHLDAYRIERPKIVFFKMGKTQNSRSNDKEVILISYNNSQFGFVDKETGKFIFTGQD